jgi:hypothetical protein
MFDYIQKIFYGILAAFLIYYIFKFTFKRHFENLNLKEIDWRAAWWIYTLGLIISVTLRKCT